MFLKYLKMKNELIYFVTFHVPQWMPIFFPPIRINDNKDEKANEMK